MSSPLASHDDCDSDSDDEEDEVEVIEIVRPAQKQSSSKQKKCKKNASSKAKARLKGHHNKQEEIVKRRTDVLTGNVNSYARVCNGPDLLKQMVQYNELTFSIASLNEA